MDSRALIQRLRNFLRHKGKLRDEADDIIQEAFLRLQEYRKTCEVVAPEAFLIRAARNISIDAHRMRERHGVHVPTEEYVHRLIDPSPLPDEVLAGQQRLLHLRRGLDTLSPRTREALLLFKIEGLSQSQIAQQLGISASAVEKHIAKAALFLSDWMAETPS